MAGAAEGVRFHPQTSVLHVNTARPRASWRSRWVHPVRVTGNASTPCIQASFAPKLHRQSAPAARYADTRTRRRGDPGRGRRTLPLSTDPPEQIQESLDRWRRDHCRHHDHEKATKHSHAKPPATVRFSISRAAFDARSRSVIRHSPPPLESASARRLSPMHPGRGGDTGFRIFSRFAPPGGPAASDTRRLFSGPVRGFKRRPAGLRAPGSGTAWHSTPPAHDQRSTSAPSAADAATEKDP